MPRHTLLRTTFSERNLAGEKTGTNTENIKGMLPECLSGFPHLSDGMSEKTLSDKEADSEVRLNRE